METSTKIGISTAAAGAIAGAGAGLKIGSNKANAMVGAAKRIKGLTKDEYINKKVSQQISGNLKNHSALKDEAGMLNVELAKDLIDKIRKSAAKRFDKVAQAPKAAIELAKKTKIKWVAGLAAAGLALGALIGVKVAHGAKED